MTARWSKWRFARRIVIPAKAGIQGAMELKNYYVYIMASKRNGTLYIGMTNDIQRRVFEHKNGLIEGFTKEYGVHLLVHIEWFGDVHDAIRREKQLKKWNRQWKLDLIEKENPQWIDIATTGYKIPRPEGSGLPPPIGSRTGSSRE